MSDRKYHMISLIYGMSKYDKSELFYKTESNSQTETNLRLTKVEDRRRGMNWEPEINR